MQPSPQQDSEIACSGASLVAQLLPDVHRAHAGSYKLQDGQYPTAELESSALVLQAMSMRVTRPPCLLVKPEFDKLSNTAFLQRKHLHHQENQ